MTDYSNYCENQQGSMETINNLLNILIASDLSEI